MLKDLPELNGITAIYNDELPWNHQDENVNAWIAQLRELPRADYKVEHSFSGQPRLPYSKWVYKGVEYTETIVFANDAKSDNYLSVAKFTPELNFL